MPGRGFWKRLTTHGLVIGSMRGDDVDQRACECRDEIRKIATVYKRFPRFAAPPTICLELEGEAFAAPVAALAPAPVKT